MMYSKALRQVIAVITLVCTVTAILSGCSAGKGTVPAAAVNTVTGKITERAATVRDRSLHVIRRDALNTPIASSGLMQIYLDDNSYGIALYEKTKDKFWYSMPTDASGRFDPAAATVTLDVLYGNTMYKLNSQDDCMQYRNIASDTLGDTSLSGFYVTYVLTGDAETAAKIDAERIFADSITKNDFARSDIAFMVRVTYELLDGNLYVSADWKNLSENPDAVVCDLSLLPFFGASAAGASGDYLLVPDGCGAMIHTDTVDPSFSPFDIRIYGENAAVADDASTIPALFPAYAAKQGDSAYAVIIEQGDAIASLHVERASAGGGLNRVSPSFCITETQSSERGGKDVLYVSRNAYSGNIKLCVRLLAGANAGLDGIAAALREQFMRSGYLPVDTVEKEEYLPFELGLIGAQSVDSFLYSGKSLTTFEQAQDLLTRMKSKGINNIDIRYLGALRGGVNQTDSGRLRLSRRLGGRKGFNELYDFAQAQGHSLFPDAALLTVNAKSRAAGALNIESGDMTLQSVMANQTYARRATRLSAMEKSVIQLLTDAKKASFDGFCVSDVGSILYSDYAERYQNRQEAMQALQQHLPSLSADRLLMIDNGNFYAIRYADIVSGLPFMPSLQERAGLYTGVPMLQMILHGTLDYSGTPINLAADRVTASLRSVEYGCCPGYVWCFSADGGDVLCYENQLNEAVDFYMKANAALADLRDARIVDHGTVGTTGVRYTQYDNDAVIYVNYSDADVAVVNIHVPALSFVRIG